MPFVGLLGVMSILSRGPLPPAPPAPAPPAVTAAAEPSVWEGGDVERCPENLRLEGSTRRLTEVPETPTGLADKTGGPPGGVPRREAWPVPCVTPARR